MENIEFLYTDLIRLGLTPAQVRVMLVMMSKGETTAKELSNILHIHLSSAYKTLESLAKLNLIDIKLGNPNVYVIRPRKELIEEFRRLIDKKYEMKRMSLHKLESTLRSLDVFTASRKSKRSSLKIIMSRERFFEEIKRHLQMIKKEYLLIMSANGIIRNVRHGLVDLYNECRKRDVEIRIISEINAKNAFEARYLIKYVKVRHKSNTWMRFNIFDDRVVLFGAVYNDEDLTLTPADEMYLLMEDKEFVKSFKIIFEELWKNSVDAELVLNSIKGIP